MIIDILSPLIGIYRDAGQEGSPLRNFDLQTAGQKGWSREHEGKRRQKWTGSQPW